MTIFYLFRKWLQRGQIWNTACTTVTWFKYTFFCFHPPSPTKSVSSVCFQHFVASSRCMYRSIQYFWFQFLLNTKNHTLLVIAILNISQCGLLQRTRWCRKCSYISSTHVRIVFSASKKHFFPPLNSNEIKIEIHDLTHAHGSEWPLGCYTCRYVERGVRSFLCFFVSFGINK